MRWGRNSIACSGNAQHTYKLVERGGRMQLEAEKMRATAVFADGLERALAVHAFPTVLVLDRAGKIVYRVEGYTDESYETQLATAVKSAVGE